MIATSQTVLMAIKAGVRLCNAGRKVYIRNTFDRAITLPLPTGPVGPNPAAARNFFESEKRGKEICEREENQRLRDLLEKGSLETDEETELLLIYQAFKREENPGESGVLEDKETMGDELVAILTIRNWQDEDEEVSNFQIIAGTLVNVAVDYFAYNPDAISDKHPQGRALRHFLEAIGEIDFSNKEIGDVIGDVMMAVIDGISCTPELISNTRIGKVLVENIATSLSRSAEKHLSNNDITSSERSDGRDWLQLIAYAFVKGGADTVLTNPECVLGVGKKEEGEVVKVVCESITDLVFGDETLDFKPLLSGNGIETVVKSFLDGVARNPGFIKIGDEGIKNILVGIADDLSQSDKLLSEKIFPELTGMILVRTAENLDLIWTEGATDPQKHLLITANRVLMQRLAKGMAEGIWPAPGKDDLLAVAEAVFDEVLENRGWVLDEIDNVPKLQTAVDAVLGAFANQERGKRLSKDTAIVALRAGVNAAALRLPLLKKLEDEGDDQGKTALTAAIDAIFDGLIGDDVPEEARWHRARSSTLKMALEIGLAKIAKVGADQKHIDALRTNVGLLIDEQVSVEEFAEVIEAKLKAA